MAVLDASVYVALTNAREDHHEAAWKWFRQALVRGELVVAPVVILAEVAAALSRGQLDPRLAGSVIQRLVHSRSVELVPVSHGLGQLAATIAATHRIRGCDAIYVALAQQLGDTLVTLDRQQLVRGASVVETRAPG